MRLVGAVLILTGCTGLGLWYRQQFIGRLQALRVLSSILEMLMSEIRYGRSTLPACCKEVATRVEEPYKNMLLQVYEDCNLAVAAPFGDIFIQKAEQILEQLPLKKEEWEIFVAPFKGQGFQDGQMQIKSLEQSFGRLQDMIRMQNEEQREKCRMSVGLGVMSGLLLIIVMI